MGTDAVQLLAVIFSGAAVVVALLGYFAVQSKNLREVIANGDKATYDASAKLRHDLAAAVNRTTTSIEVDLKALQREAARKEDMTTMENRWSSTANRLEAKMDNMATQLAHLSGLEATIKACTGQLDGIANRMDAREAREGRG